MYYVLFVRTIYNLNVLLAELAGRWPSIPAAARESEKPPYPEVTACTPLRRAALAGNSNRLLVVDVLYNNACGGTRWRVEPKNYTNMYYTQLEKHGQKLDIQFVKWIVSLED